MKTITDPLELIKSFEGCRLDVYKDQAGWLTVGWGHRVLSVEPYKLNKKITQEQADALLAKDYERVAKGVNSLIHVNLNPHQTAALTSLAFNIGLGAFERSTLLNLLNTSRFQAAADEFLRWEMVGVVRNRILELRREQERALFVLPYVAL